MKAANYHRVSTLDQNPTLAREELLAAAKARGFEVVLDIEETGSGARNDRPGLQRILEAARKGTIQAVVVYKLDRFGRSALDVLANVQTLTDCGVRFVAITQGLDVQPRGDATSKLILTVLAAVAEFERELIRERTMTGLSRARQLGRKLGRPGISEEVKGKIEKLASSGLGAYRVAQMLGMKESTVRTYTRRFDSMRGKGTTKTKGET